MDLIKEYKKKIILQSLKFFTLVFIICVVINKNSFTLAFLLGFCLSIVNFHLLSKEASKLPQLAQNGFRAFILIRYFFRYFMMALGTYVALLHELNIYLFAIGLFTIQITIYADTLIANKQ